MTSAAFLLFIITILAGLYPFWRQLKQGAAYDFLAGEALAAGIFLAAGLLHMLGDAAERFLSAGIHYPMAEFLAGAVFLLLLLLEHLGREVYEHDNGRHFALLACLLLSIHAFLVGTAWGLNDSYPMFFALLIAILAHKWAESFSLAVQLNKSDFSFRVRILLFLAFSLTLPLGIFLGHFVLNEFHQMPLVQPVFSAFSAGTFLYLGTLHGLTKGIMVQKCCNLRKFTFMLIGFSVMSILAIWT